MQNNNNNNNNNKRKLHIDIMFIIILIVAGICMFLLIRNLTTQQAQVLDYTKIVTYINEGKISGELQATPAGGDNLGLYVVTGKFVNDGITYKFTANLLEENVFALQNTFTQVTVKINTLSSNVWLAIIINIIPYVIFIGIFIWLLKSQGGNSKAFDFGKSTAQLSRSKTVTFKDVAGCDEEKEELVEIIDFLKNPRKYNEIGARVPKGVLLFGPPGTGKTLLAKAVAGEAGVAFFSISGSDFVEMFVGVGASRVRDMFKTAKQNAPCIVFIDEIDAVGRQRGAGMGGGHDEREQTLNQLLVEMDGFNNNTGIIVMAATNRPDVLDPALLRPGRFDRQITISNPDVNGREAILKVHARNKHLEPTVILSDIAQRIPGFSGADIENLLNEAALLAARDNRKTISTQDIDEAIDRVMMGPAKKSRKISDAEKNLVAHHEAGHAVIGLKLENANIVQKVTIVPRGQAGGYALMLPEEERYLETKQSLLDRITGYLGGRVSEEVNFGEISTGASNDFEMATKIARAMVTEYGMSDLGPIQYEKPNGSVFLGRDYLKDKNFSDQVALEIDREVRNIVEGCYKRAKECITQNLELVKRIAYYLIKVETLTKQDILEIEQTNHLKWYDEKEEKDLERKKAKEEAIAKASNDNTNASSNKLVDDEKEITVVKDDEIISEDNKENE